MKSCISQVASGVELKQEIFNAHCYIVTVTANRPHETRLGKGMRVGYNTKLDEVKKICHKTLSTCRFLTITATATTWSLQRMFIMEHENSFVACS